MLNSQNLILIHPFPFPSIPSGEEERERERRGESTMAMAQSLLGVPFSRLLPSSSSSSPPTPTTIPPPPLPSSSWSPPSRRRRRAVAAASSLHLAPEDIAELVRNKVRLSAWPGGRFFPYGGWLDILFNFFLWRRFWLRRRRRARSASSASPSLPPARMAPPAPLTSGLPSAQAGCPPPTPRWDDHDTCLACNLPCLSFFFLMLYCNGNCA